MTEINKILAQNKLSIDEVPNRIHQKINYFEELKTDLIETKKELESEKDEATRKEIRKAILEAESLYEEVLGDIADEISEFAEEKHEHDKKVAAQAQAASAAKAQKEKHEHDKKVAAQAQAASAAKAQKEKEAAEQAQSQTTPDAKTDTTKPQKKSGMLGWFIGGAILVVTLGAVNVMNRR